MDMRLFKIDSDRNLAGEVTEAFQRKGIAGSKFSRNLKIIRALFTVLRKKREEAAKDRAGYGASLLSTYDTLADQINELSDFILAVNGKIDPKTFDDISQQFELFTFAFYEPLADNLTYDEEERLRWIMDKLRESMKRLFGAFRVRRLCDYDESLAYERIAIECADFVEDFYLGEVETELSDDFIVARDDFEKLLKSVGERYK